MMTVGRVIVRIGAAGMPGAGMRTSERTSRALSSSEIGHVHGGSIGSMAKRVGGIVWWGLAALMLLLSRWVPVRSWFARDRSAPSSSRPVPHSPPAIMLLASDRLSRLAERWTNDGEVFLLLGESELERSRKEPPDRRTEAAAWATAALAAWAKVPTASPYFGRASLLAATHLINTGRYAPAEDVLHEGAGGSGAYRRATSSSGP